MPEDATRKILSVEELFKLNADLAIQLQGRAVFEVYEARKEFAATTASTTHSLQREYDSDTHGRQHPRDVDCQRRQYHDRNGMHSPHRQPYCRDNMHRRKHSRRGDRASDSTGDSYREIHQQRVPRNEQERSREHYGSAFLSPLPVATGPQSQPHEHQQTHEHQQPQPQGREAMSRQAAGRAGRKRDDDDNALLSPLSESDSEQQPRQSNPQASWGAQGQQHRRKRAKTKTKTKADHKHEKATKKTVATHVHAALKQHYKGKGKTIEHSTYKTVCKAIVTRMVDEMDGNTCTEHDQRGLQARAEKLVLIELDADHFLDSW
jgi:hypothetical protein